MSYQRESYSSSRTTSTTRSEVIKERPRFQHVQRQIILYRGDGGNLNLGGLIQEASVTQSKSLSQNQNFGPTSGRWDAADDKYVSSFSSQIDGDNAWMVKLNSKLEEWIERFKKEEERHDELVAENERLKRAGRPTDYSNAIADVIKMGDEQVYKDIRTERERNNRLKVADLEQRDLYDSLKYRYDGLKDNIDNVDKEIVRLRNEIANREVKIRLHDGQLKALDEQSTRERELAKSMAVELREARNGLNKETLEHIRSENDKYTVEELVQFIKYIYELEIKRLRDGYTGETGAVISEDWNAEMASALQEIRALYDGRMGTLRHELEAHYQIRVQQFTEQRADQNLDIVREEVSVQRGEIGKLRDSLKTDSSRRADEMRSEVEKRKYSNLEMKEKYRKELAELARQRRESDAELSSIKSDLERILVSKNNMELEIQVYEDLLEGIYKKKTQVRRNVQQKRTEEAVRITSTDISINNFDAADRNLSNFKLSRFMNGREVQFFTFPRGTMLRAHDKITVWAAGKLPEDSEESDLEADFDEWVMGKAGDRMAIKLFSNLGKVIVNIDG